MHMAESNPEDLGKQSGVGNGAAEAETSARETKLNYEGSSKHGQTARGTAKGFASAEPKDGQVALNNSLQVKATSPRRIGVDLRNQEFVVFDETYPGKGIFHGHVRSWHELTPEMQQTLIKADKVTKKGKIIGD